MNAFTTADPWADVKRRKQAYFEYVRDSGFKDEIGTSPFNIIQFSNELATGGGEIAFNLLGRLKGTGVSGDTTLQGNEEPMDKYSHKVALEFYRHAMKATKKQQHISEIGLYNKFSPLLKDWCTNLLRGSIIDSFMMTSSHKCFHAPQIPLNVVGEDRSGINALATDAENNTWHEANKARLYYGSKAANHTANDFAASLGKIVKADGYLSAKKLSFIKRRMKTADPSFKPIRGGKDGREFFKVYVDSNNMGSLKEDEVMVKANREARPRDVKSNPLFQDGDLIYDGMIVREIPEIPTMAGAGLDCDVSPAFFCGAQAIAYAQGQAMQYTRNTNDDYGYIRNRGVEEFFGISKMQKDGLDHGVFTFFGAVNPNLDVI